MFFCPPPFMRVSSAVPRSLAAIARQSDTANQSSYSFNIDFGAAELGKIGALCFSHYASLASGVTVGGVAAALVAASPGATGSVRASMWRCDASAGGVRSVVISMVGTAQVCIIDPFTISGTTGVPVDAFGIDAGNAGSISDALDIVANGIAIAMVVDDGNRPYTWTGLTEIIDAGVEGHGCSTAASSGLTAETGRTITAAHTAGGTNPHAFVGASW